MGILSTQDTRYDAQDMSNYKGPRRAGPARARALAKKDDATDDLPSATAWLDGAHEAIVLHPEWAQLQGHLQELMAGAARANLADSQQTVHPHAIEAARQVLGGHLSMNESNVSPEPARPHLLHEPYMSAAGASKLLGQTLADIAEVVDEQAEVRGTLKSAEFLAFDALVRSVYVGSVQKRALYARIDTKMSHETTKGATSTTDDRGSDQHATGDIKTDAPGVSQRGASSSSSDIAQALVAVAMGDGFERFLTTRDGGGPIGGGGEEAQGGKHLPGVGGGLQKQGGGAGDGSIESKGVGEDLQRLLINQPNLSSKAAALQHLSEDAEVVRGESSIGGEEEGGRKPQVAERARFPGLEWLAPHIVGRSIPMTLRRELWERSLLQGGSGSPSPAEVKRLIGRYAGEKGIVDPTNTPIAGMIATGVRHRAAEAFPWLARGGATELGLRQRICREAEQLLNKYYVFVGKHEARHVASSLILAYVFNREGVPGDKKQAAKKRDGALLPLDGGVSEIGGGGDEALVAMLHSLSTRFAPAREDLCSGFRERAYEEIRRRDPPLFDHLSALFPGYKYAQDGREEDANAANVVPGDGIMAQRGLIEAWLEDALVGHLREDALLFVWDHLFLLGWQEQLPLFVADIALHLRVTLIRATAPLTLVSLARDACRRVCTRDLREVFRRRTTGSVSKR